jgi:hypothetical protein
MRLPEPGKASAGRADFLGCARYGLHPFGELLCAALASPQGEASRVSR